MSRRPCGALVAGLLVVMVAAACGKKGNPLPPLRPTPSRINDLTAHRIDNRVELQFTVPPVNADGSTPAAISRVEIYRLASPQGAPPASAPSATVPLTTAPPETMPPVTVPPAPAPPATVPPTTVPPTTVPPTTARPTTARLASGPPAISAQMMAVRSNLRAEIRVRPDSSSPPSVKTDTTPAALPAPAPGDRVSFVDSIDSTEVANVATWSYVVVGVVGRSTRGPASAVVNVPIAMLPPPPDSLSVSFTETEFTLSWRPANPAQSFNVFPVDRLPGATPPTSLTPKPITASEFKLPVEFGRERCFAVRAVTTAGSATVEGPLSSVACTTAIDQYPPPAPTDLQAIQEGTSVTLNWTGVEAADLAGYIVLRGDATGVSLLPLMRQPVRETTFTDSTVRPGGTYTYSVYAVDTAPAPNVSQQSNRQVVTVR